MCMMLVRAVVAVTSCASRRSHQLCSTSSRLRSSTVPAALSMDAIQPAAVPVLHASNGVHPQTQGTCQRRHVRQHRMQPAVAPPPCPWPQPPAACRQQQQQRRWRQQSVRCHAYYQHHHHDHHQQQQRPVRCHANQQQPPDAQAAMAQVNSILAELRADPELAPLLTDAKLVAAVREVAANPAALSQHASNPKVMAVLTRLAALNMSRQQSAAFEAAGTSPEALVRQMAANSELSALLSKPTVRQALSKIRTAADPDAEMAAAQGDPDVKRALDLLEAAVVGGTGDVVLDV